MKKHLHQKSFPMGQTRCSWLYSFRNDSLNCDRDKSREITTTEPPHLYILLFFASQLLNILFDFCGVSTIRFLSLSSSFCLKKIENPSEKSGVMGWRKNVAIFLSRSVLPDMSACVIVIVTVPGSKIGSPSSCLPNEFFEADNELAVEVRAEIEDVKTDVETLNYPQIGLLCAHLILAFVNAISTCVRRRTNYADAPPTDGQRMRRRSVFLA